MLVPEARAGLFRTSAIPRLLGISTSRPAASPRSAPRRPRAHTNLVRASSRSSKHRPFGLPSEYPRPRGVAAIRPAPPAGLQGELPAGELQSFNIDWTPAEARPGAILAMILGEVNKGYVREWTRSWDEARKARSNAASGKLGVISVPNKDDRLTLDSTIAEVSPAIEFEEKTFVGGVADVAATAPESLPEAGDDEVALNADVKGGA